MQLRFLRRGIGTWAGSGGCESENRWDFEEAGRIPRVGRSRQRLKAGSSQKGGLTEDDTWDDVRTCFGRESAGAREPVRKFREDQLGVSISMGEYIKETKERWRQ